MEKGNKLISICVPCYNEEQNIRAAYEAISGQVRHLQGYGYEILFADNGSDDGSEMVFRALASEDKHVRIILNQTNFGVDPSITNLLAKASGDAVIMISCDLQEPPEMIPEFIKEWERGHEVVWGQKTESDENPIKYLCRKVFYGIINRLSDYRQFHQVTGFGLISREVRDIIIIQKRQDPEMNIRHIVGRYGFDVKLLQYRQRERQRGKSSYNVYRYYEFAISSLCVTSLKPLRLMTITGMVTSFGCIMVAFVYLVYKLTHWMTFAAGIAPLMIGLFFVLGLTLFCIGILGEYIGILIRRVTDQPAVVERETINFDGDGK